MAAIITGVLRNVGALRRVGTIALVGLGFFALAYDQGQILSTVIGNVAYQQNWLHEFFHDARHTGAFQCH